MTADMNWVQVLSNIIPNIVKMTYWVNKPVTNTTQSNLEIATHMQLLCTVPVVSCHRGDTAAYWYHISTCSPTSVRKEGSLCLLACLPHRGWFQDQDCGAQREENQTPDLVSRRQDVVSWCFFSINNGQGQNMVWAAKYLVGEFMGT